MGVVNYKFSGLELVLLLSIDRIQSAINAFEETLDKEQESFIDNSTQEIYQQISAVMRENWKLKNLLNSKKTELLEKQKR
jgi:hypothetical protein